MPTARSRLSPPPHSYFEPMFNKSAPAPGDAFPLKGCIFGCIVALDDEYAQLQSNFSSGFGWSG